MLVYTIHTWACQASGRGNLGGLMDQTGVLLEKRGGMATITLNRPNNRNALSAKMRAALAARLADVATDRDVSVVLLRGEGSVFCGGLDLSDLPDNPMAWRERVL